jgi:hypothetical protein
VRRILYLLKSNSGILSAFDAATGKPHLGISVSMMCQTCSRRLSPLRAHLHPRPEGTTVVVKHGPMFEVLAVNKLDDGFNASARWWTTPSTFAAKYLYAIAGSASTEGSEAGPKPRPAWYSMSAR